MNGCAVKVTEVPEQMLVALAEILTESVTPDELTVIVIALDVDVAGVAQEPDGVMTQVTTAALVRVVVVKVAPPVPALTPLTFH